jgi:rsbT co-antagonist protein RsbR
MRPRQWRADAPGTDTMEQDNETIAAMRAEIESLRAANAALGRRVAELEQRQQLLTGVIENSPSSISVKDLSRRLLLVNEAVVRVMGRPREELVGRTEDELFGADTIAEWAEHDRRVAEGGRAISSEAVVPSDDGDRIYISHKFPLRDESGAVYALGSIVTDITDQKRSEAERLDLQRQVIDAQQAALRELGTPLVPIADGVVAMPLVGTIDSFRAQMIMETLLEGISARQADVAILDITGVRVVDTQVASALLRAAQAAQLLGARVVLTGIGAEVAQSLVHLGADLSRIEVRSNLQAGVAAALQGL